MAERPLTPEQKKKLRAAGFTDGQIAAYQQNKLTGNTLSRVTQSLAGGGTIVRQPSPNNQSYGASNTPLPQSAAGGGRQQVGGSFGQNTSLGGALRGSALGQLFSNFDGSGIVDKIVKPAVAVAKGALGRTASGIGAQAVGKRGPMAGANPGGFDDFNLPEFNAPQLSYRDFSGQARDQIAGIYAPRYAAIDNAAQNAQGQYKRSDQITSGLYENLARNIADISAKSAAQYRDAQATQASNTQNLVNQQGQNYTSAQQQEAQLLQQLGQGEAAQQVLGDNSAEQAYQQGQAQAEGNRQGAALATNNQSAQDYYGNMNNANQTAGTTARQSLIAQLGDVLQSYDRDRMNLQGDQSQAALQLGQQLSDRDFSAQQANYGIARDQYSSQVDQQKFAYEQAMQRQQLLQDAARQNQQQANVDRDFAFQQQKYGTDLATALAEQRLSEQKLAGQGAGLEFSNQDPVSKTVQQISSAAGGDTATASKYYDFVRQATANFAANGIDAAPLVGNQFAFVQQIAQEARNRNLDPLVAQAAAAAYWQNILGKKQ
jgi:hypothetical protein